MTRTLARGPQLGLRENLAQFSLLVLVNAFVGAMVGLERTILPEIAQQEFHLVAKTAILSFIVVFGFVKAFTNYFAGRLSDRIGRKAVLVAGWICAVPVPLLLMWAPTWNWVLVANLFLGLSQGLTWSTTVIMKIDLVGPKRRGFAMGLNEFSGYCAVAVSALNFHFKGADQAIEPMAFALAPVEYLRCILIRLTPGKIPESLKSVENSWKLIVPDYPLEYTFIDQDYERLFRAEIRTTGLLKYFTILAIISACLGLYGLSSFSAERRTNEVGIRKVMGADSLAVMYTLSREFLLPVLISIILAIPVGWIIVRNLLKQFAYRIDISIIVFAVIAIGAIAIALFTVSFQAYKATGINPAEALKVE